MGREVRRVPADWQHPKISKLNYRTGMIEERYQPMYDKPYGEAIDEWIKEYQAWERGERPSYCSDECTGMKYWEYSGAPPDPAYYRPEWTDAERTHLMMYEDTSEGTPISPAFLTPEEVARWLADNETSAFGRETASYEAWLSIARGGWAPSMVFADGVLQNGVAAAIAQRGGA